MKILALSTSTPRGSAAVLSDDLVLGSSDYVDLAGHAERIFSAIEQALAAAALRSSDIDLLACDIGPGSFTGVRVGVASAKGLALGMHRPLVGVGSLEAMAAAAFARGLAAPTDLVVPVLDAKKQEFFLAAYDATGRTRMPPAHVLITAAPDRVREYLENTLTHGSRLHIVGEAAQLEASWAERVLRASELDLPDAAEVGRLARQRFASTPGDPAIIWDASMVEPTYVRPPDAKPMATGVEV